MVVQSKPLEVITEFSEQTINTLYDDLNGSYTAKIRARLEELLYNRVEKEEC